MTVIEGFKKMPYFSGNMALATRYNISVALVFQQLFNMCLYAKHRYGYAYDSFFYMSYSKIYAQTSLSKTTIAKAIQLLEDEQLITVRKEDKNYYRIHWETLQAIMKLHSCVLPQYEYDMLRESANLDDDM